MRNNDLTGKKFGRLTVIKRDEDRIQPSGQHKARWLCKCDCGNPNLKIGLAEIHYVFSIVNECEYK